MATVPETQTRRGFRAPCPHCGAESIRVDLWNVDTLACVSCDEEFSLDSIRALVEGWTAVLKWIDTVPDYPSE